MSIYRFASDVLFSLLLPKETSLIAVLSTLLLFCLCAVAPLSCIQADETSISIIIPRAYHAGLIGSSGKYAIRLEEKYGVKITFPKNDREGSDQKPDEVLIRGGKKGVASAKAELMEAADYEKETGQSLTFTIPSRAVARVLGKAGSQINEIKEETDAQIDVEKADSSTPTTNITYVTDVSSRFIVV